MDERNLQARMIDGIENIAAELERLRLLREYELGVEVKYEAGAPYVEQVGEDRSA
jgi:hypothetical protein